MSAPMNHLTRRLNFLLKLNVAPFQNHSRHLSSSDSLRCESKGDYSSELGRVRNVSRLPKHLRNRLLDLDKQELPENMDEVPLRYKRKLYAKHGTASNIDPAIMWPTRSELKLMVEDQKELEPELQDMIHAIQIRKEKEEAIIKERQEEIEKNMKQMDKWIQERNLRIQKEQQKTRDNDLTMEVEAELYQIYGYNIDKRDHRWRLKLEEKLEERKLKAAADRKLAKKEAAEKKKAARMAQSQKKKNKQEKTEPVEEEDED